jgi:lantibiotic modifying enzyme
MKKLLTLQNKELANKLHMKLEEIVNCLTYLKVDKNWSPSLFSGYAGIILFLFYYSQYSKKEYYANKAMNFLSFIFENIKTQDYTFCNGMSGVCWCIQHLIKQRFIDIENFDILDHFDNYLCKHALFSLQVHKNIDFLHGSIGTALYLLNRLEIAEIKRFEEDVIVSLNDQKIQVNDFYCWESIMGEKYNISLSHGMASTCIFLAKAFCLNICKSLVKDLLEKSISFLLAQEIKSSNRLSYFPTFALLDKSNPLSSMSRMSWCYGDLGIAIAIWHSSRAINDKKMEQKAIDVLLHASDRTDLNLNMLHDAGICHGTAGVSLIFRRMYINTGIIKFKTISEYWIEQTLLMSKYLDAPAGYKADAKTDSYDLLTGITGIGLAFLSFLTNEDTNWDECLLLS